MQFFVIYSIPYIWLALNINKKDILKPIPFVICPFIHFQNALPKNFVICPFIHFQNALPKLPGKREENSPSN